MERPLHSCMPCPFRCSLYLSLFRLRLPEYTHVLLFFCARRLVWCADVSLFPLRCSPSRETLLMLPFAYSLGLPLLAGGIPPTHRRPTGYSKRSGRVDVQIGRRWRGHAPLPQTCELASASPSSATSPPLPASRSQRPSVGRGRGTPSCSAAQACRRRGRRRRLLLSRRARWRCRRRSRSGSPPR